MQEPRYSMTNESISVIWEGKSYTVRKSQPNFVGLRDCLIDKRWDDIKNFITVSKGLEAFVRGKFSLKDGTFYFQDEALPSTLSDRIRKMAAAGEDPERLFKFWERLQKNPSKRSVDQLYSFLAHQGIPITKEGYFLAYKGVQNNYRDKHSGKWDNAPGSVNEMLRNKVSDDPKEACHEGFHVGDLSYARSFASKVMICLVDPEHVVSVPYDESHRKMRVCKYKVIGEYNGQAMPDTSFDDFEEPEDVKGEEKPKDNFTPPSPEEGKQLLRTAKGHFKKYDKLDEKGLLDLSLDDLRQYAFKGLEIVGASKIPGGKIGLIHRIKEVRGV